VTLLFVAHGSPSPTYRAEAEALLALWQMQHHGAKALLSYVEMEPYFHDVVSCATTPLLVMPLFLHEGKHYQDDVMAVVRHGLAEGKNIQVLPALTNPQTMADVLLAQFQQHSLKEAQLVLFSHGTRSDKKHAAVAAIADLIQQKTLKPCCIALAQGQPSLQQNLTDVVNAGASNIMILPHFIFGGAWQEKAQQVIDEINKNHGVDIILLSPMHVNPALLHVVSHQIALHNP